MLVLVVFHKKKKIETPWIYLGDLTWNHPFIRKYIFLQQLYAPQYAHTYESPNQPFLHAHMQAHMHPK